VQGFFKFIHLFQITGAKIRFFIEKNK
jgi:hypothetical protein